MNDPGTATNGGLLARLEGDMRNLLDAFREQRVTQDDRWRKIEPVLMERSGDLRRFSDFEADLNSLGAKYRATEARFNLVETELRRIEQRQNKVFWMFIGASSALQLLWLLMGDNIRRALLGG